MREKALQSQDQKLAEQRELIQYSLGEAKMGKTKAVADANTLLIELIIRADRKSQVMKCLGFCSADSKADEDHKSDVQKPKHCLT